MRKIFMFLCVCIIVLTAASCAGRKSAQQTKPIEVTLSLVKNLAKTGGVEGLRFYPESSFELTLDEAPENGIWETTRKGDVKLLSPQTIKFPNKKLGRFENTSEAVIVKGKIPTVWEEDFTENGEVLLSMEYTEKGELRLKQETSSSDAKPAVMYGGAKYTLPDNFRDIKFMVAKVGKSSKREVSGVKRPKR